jgi:hypothetical protein
LITLYIPKHRKPLKDPAIRAELRGKEIISMKTVGTDLVIQYRRISDARD